MLHSNDFSNWNVAAGVGAPFRSQIPSLDNLRQACALGPQPPYFVMIHNTVQHEAAAQRAWGANLS